MSAQGFNNGTDSLSKYLLNLGAYLGYDLSTAPPSSTPPSPLISTTAIENPQLTSIETFFGSMPVNAISSALMSFVPSSNPVYSTLNTLANATFTTPPYKTPAQDGNVSVNKLIDQTTFQNDPVSQAILNMLGTPDHSYCMSNDNSSWTGGQSQGLSGTSQNNSFPTCKYLSGLNVKLNILGIGDNSEANSTPPNPTEFFSYKYNQQILGQLNSNTLISPLLYTTTGNTSTGSSTQSAQNGLPVQSQAQQAANFIRYATSGVSPVSLPSQSVYSKAFTAAITSPGTATQVQAESNLATYLTSLRVFAAQSSVGFGNLYYILGKRLPQNIIVPGSPGSDNPSSNPKSSQALSEFTMATWRLFNPAPSAKPWLAQINNASSATVQKEMVTLLAEINYQLYLNRQQEERLLLTNTMLLLQTAKQAAPSADKLDPQQENNP
jgi:intracellular multiplication protein IcmX